MDSARMVIYMDAPFYMDDIRRKPFVSDGAELLKNLLGRMSLSVENGDVYLDYVVKCYAGKKMPSKRHERLKCVEACSFYRFATLQNMPNVKAVVGMGRLCLEAFTGSSEIGDYEGECWTPAEVQMRQFIRHIWMTYSPAYLLEKPAEIPNIYRVIFTAAQEAGLEPKPNLKHPHYKWDN